MDFIGSALLGLVVLFVGMLASAETGRRIGRARLARDPDGLEKGVGAAEGALFALLGLLLAFSFSGAASRLEHRKELIVSEANDIGTAFLRVDLLPREQQPAMRALFRDYLDSRLATYRDVQDPAAIQAGLDRSEALRARIWAAAVADSARADAHPDAGKLLLPALNAMFDIATTRSMATRNHPPAIVYLLLVCLSLLTSLLVGYEASVNKKRDWLHTLTFAAILSLTTYVIVDLEFPRLGMIRVDAFDQVLVELRRSMG